MRNLFKKHSLTIQLSIIFIVVVIVSIALLIEAIELATCISIYAVLIAISILLISINEIRNRLRPWVAVAKIEFEEPGAFQETYIEYFYFAIANTGPIPANRLTYTVTWYIRENREWQAIENGNDSPFISSPYILFPNQRILYEVSMPRLRELTGGKETKVTFLIDYRGLWSKHTTTNTFKYDHTNNNWVVGEPQDYT